MGSFKGDMGIGVDVDWDNIDSDTKIPLKGRSRPCTLPGLR